MQYDTNIVERFGTSISDPAFIKDCAQDGLLGEFNKASFIGSDNSTIDVFIPSQTLFVLDRIGKSLDEVNLDELCEWVVCDHSQDSFPTVMYIPTETETAREQYLKDHSDIKACPLDLYSQVAYDEYVADDAIAMSERAFELIGDTETRNPVFDVEKYFQVTQPWGDIADRMDQLGIVRYYTDYEELNLKLREACCKTGLFAVNDEVEAYIDDYRDAHKGESPDSSSYFYLTRREEAERLNTIFDYQDIVNADKLNALYELDDAIADEMFDFDAYEVFHLGD